jgi:hypothetical protein
MRGKKVKKIRKEYEKLGIETQYNINSQVVEGITFRQFKKGFDTNKK